MDKKLKDIYNYFLDCPANEVEKMEKEYKYAGFEEICKRCEFNTNLKNYRKRIEKFLTSQAHF